MTNRSAVHSIDEYIAEFLPETQQVLEALRALIRASAPAATETIGYAIPTFDLNGQHLVHFAGYGGHVGFYPGSSGIKAFVGEFSLTKARKARSSFPWASH